ncbi:MAG: fumarylacetoacetate hydrolase family protein [Anaerolineae bacterium]|nr:fumarylacetoacetate hydrolase family protein [Anaerolineae bacterium]
MKLVTFLYQNRTRLGALTASGNEVVDLNLANNAIPDSIIAFLEAGGQALTLAQQAVSSAPAAATIQRSAVTLKAPIPRPGKIICIGLNYRDHAGETGQAVPTFPTVFAKFNNCVIGPDEPIVIPKLTEQVDYEAELAFVIGKKARHVPVGQALDYVAGYVPFHDVSARDYQNRTSQWTLGKTFETFGPMGPALVTADEIPDPQSLDISLSIGGEVLQKSNTRELVFGIRELLSILSGIMTLEPGDLVSTGTPSGVGVARNPKRWLRPGETVKLEIAKLGVLSNPVIAES